MALITKLTPLLPAIGRMDGDPHFMFYTMALLDNAPDYFWTVPASSTGKNHRADENGEGGLVHHTARACAVGEHLIRAFDYQWNSKPFIANYVRAALLLHDSFRSGDGENLFTRDGQLATDPMHMLHPRREFAKVSLSNIMQRDSRAWLTPITIVRVCHLPVVSVAATEFPYFNLLMDLIEGHYRRWSPSPKLNPEPGTPAHVVFMADYIASRLNINVEV